MASQLRNAAGGATVGQVNINPGTPSGPSESGFATGMLIGIAILILVVVVLIFLAGPRIFNSNTNQRSQLDALALVA